MSASQQPKEQPDSLPSSNNDNKGEDEKREKEEQKKQKESFALEGDFQCVEQSANYIVIGTFDVLYIENTSTGRTEQIVSPTSGLSCIKINEANKTLLVVYGRLASYTAVFRIPFTV